VKRIRIGGRMALGIIAFTAMAVVDLWQHRHDPPDGER
jgi:hypothetical protein